jgi:hypothetical protein
MTLLGEQPDHLPPPAEQTEVTADQMVALEEK